MNIKNLFVFILLCIFLSGCSSEDSSSTNTNSEKSLNSGHVTKASDANNDSDNAYNSIRDYYDSISGETYKTGILEISPINSEKHQYLLKLNVWIDSKLQERLANTEKDYWFTFRDIPGNDLIQRNVALAPEPLNGKPLISNIKENIISIEQVMILNDEISSKDLEELLNPENYSFEILDEHKDPTAATLGLELDMIN